MMVYMDGHISESDYNQASSFGASSQGASSMLLAWWPTGWSTRCGGDGLRLLEQGAGTTITDRSCLATWRAMLDQGDQHE